MATRTRLVLGFLLPVLACADRDLIDVLDPATLEDRPFTPGELYSACEHGDACLDAWCLSPADEPGFCTQLCDPAGDVSTYCDDSEVPAGTADVVCLAVGDHAACALDCGDGRSCPAGMRCEQVDALGQPRSICF
jgi:hypothetical protein